MRHEQIQLCYCMLNNQCFFIRIAYLWVHSARESKSLNLCWDCQTVNIEVGSLNQARGRYFRLKFYLTRIFTPSKVHLLSLCIIVPFINEN